MCRFLPALALTLGLGQAAWGDEFSDRATRIGQVAIEASGRMSRLQGAALSRAQLLHGELLAKKLELDRLAGDLSARQGRIAEQQRTNQFRKVEWETAEAAYKRFADDYQRKQNDLKNEADAVKRDRDAYERDVAPHNQNVRDFDQFVAPLNAELRGYDQDVLNHNSDAAAQRDAVAYFNSLPANQRSQAEADRLNRWRDIVNNRKANLDSRRGNLNARVADSNNRRRAINNSKAQLDTRQAQLRNRSQSLTQRAQTLITTDGRTMLDLRLATSTKQRAYVDGNTELQRLQSAQQQQIGTFNSAGSQADALTNSLQAAIAQTTTTGNQSAAPPQAQIDTRNLANLDPAFRTKIESIMRTLIDKGWQPYVASGRRTQAEQDEKVRLGYSKSHHSAHIYGLGADIVDRRHGWNLRETDQFWKDLRDAAVAQGLISGLDWTRFPDRAHVEMPGWQSRIPKK